jgi:hypothetical protein
VPATEQPDGRCWIVEPLDTRSAITYIREGEITVTQWVRSLRRIDEAAWWSRDEPLPFLAMAVSLLTGRARKRLRRHGARD